MTTGYKGLSRKRKPKSFFKCEKCESEFAQEYTICPVCRAVSSIKKQLKRVKKHKPIKALKSDFPFNSQLELFKHLWKTNPHISAISGRDLSKYNGTQRWYWCFAHILNKNLWSHYKLNPNNIMLLDPEEHVLIDHGNQDRRKDYVERMAKQKIKVDFSIFYSKQAILKNEYLNSYNFVNKNDYEKTTETED